MIFLFFPACVLHIPNLDQMLSKLSLIKAFDKDWKIYIIVFVVLFAISFIGNCVILRSKRPSRKSGIKKLTPSHPKLKFKVALFNAIAGIAMIFVAHNLMIYADTGELIIGGKTLIGGGNKIEKTVDTEYNHESRSPKTNRMPKWDTGSDNETFSRHDRDRDRRRPPDSPEFYRPSSPY